MDIIIVNQDESFSYSLSQYMKGSGDFNVLRSFKNFSAFLKFSEDKRNLYDLIILDLEMPELELDVFLNAMQKNSKVIALTSYEKNIFDYMDFPYFQRLFLKSVSLSNILTYISVQNGIETFEGLRKFMIQSLSEHGFNLNHSGTQYLIEGTIFSLKSHVKKLSDIYTFLGYKHSEDPKIISWSVNNAINRAIKHCSDTKLRSFFKIYENRRLSAKYIISFFINYGPINQ